MCWITKIHLCQQRFIIQYSISYVNSSLLRSRSYVEISIIKPFLESHARFWKDM